MSDERFAIELEACRKSLLALAGRRGIYGENAQDLVQETCIRAWRKRKNFKGDASLLNWCSRIIGRLIIDKKRYDSHRPVLACSMDDLVPGTTMTYESGLADPKDAYAEFAGDQFVDDFLQSLPDTNQTRVLRLLITEGHSVTECAKLLNLNRITVGTNAHRARVKLQPLLKQALAS